MADEDVTSVGDMSVEELMETLGVSRPQAEELLAIEHGTWAGDVHVVDEEGNSTPVQHGENWKPD